MSVAWSFLQRATVALALAMAAVLPLLTIAFGTVTFADGSLFVLSILGPDPWTLVWASYPNRLSSFLLTILPPFLVARTTGSAEAATAAYGLILGALPLVSLLLTMRLAGARSVIAFGCAASTILAAFCVAFFPTELWLTHAAFWPLAALALGPPGCTPLVLLGPALFTAFTHEAALPPLSLLLAAAVVRRPSRGLIAVTAITLGLPVLVKLVAPIPNADIARTVGENAWNFLTADFLRSWMVDRGVVAGLAAGGVALILGRRNAGLAVAAAVLIALLAILALLLMPGELHVLRRYLTRTLVFVALVLAASALLAAELEARFAPGLLIAARTRISPLVVPLLTALAVTIGVTAAGHAVETARFLGAWSALRTALSASAIDVAELPRGHLLVDRDERYWRGEGRDNDRRWVVAWNWGIPFQWAVMPGRTDSGAMPFMPSAPFAPVRCSHMTAMEPRFLVAPERIAILRARICDIEANSLVDRLPH